MATTEPRFRTAPRTITKTVQEVATDLHISERAVLKQISTGKLAAKREGRQWRIILLAPLPSEPLTEHGSQNGAEHSTQFADDLGETGTVNGSVAGSERRTAPQIPSAQSQQLDAIMSQWLAPLTARIESLAGENGELRADLRHEQEHRKLIEEQRDELQTRLDTLEARGRAAPDAPESTIRTQTEEMPVTSATTSQNGVQPRRWWQWLLGRE